ncbi:MAG: cupredoxin domain-containing protein [Ilumatobacteraceae bacterium]
MSRPATSTTTTQPSVITASQISINNFTFAVASNVKSTSSIKVTNRDNTFHSVTANTGVFDVTVAGGSTATLPTLKPGTYAFHCRFHDSMSGTLVVS